MEVETLLGIPGLAKILHGLCIPGAQVWCFLNVPFTLPCGRQTLPYIVGGLRLEASFQPFLYVVSGPYTWAYPVPPSSRCFGFYLFLVIVDFCLRLGWWGEAGLGKGMELCPIQHQIPMLYLSLRRDTKVSYISPSVRVCFCKRSFQEVSGVLVSAALAEALLGLLPALPLIFLESTHWGLWRNVREWMWTLICIWGAQGFYTQCSLPHLAFNYLLTFQFFLRTCFYETYCFLLYSFFSLLSEVFAIFWSSVYHTQFIERVTLALWCAAFSCSQGGSIILLQLQNLF